MCTIVLADAVCCGTVTVVAELAVVFVGLLVLTGVVVLAGGVVLEEDAGVDAVFLAVVELLLPEPVLTTLPSVPPLLIWPPDDRLMPAEPTLTDCEELLFRVGAF